MFVSPLVLLPYMYWRRWTEMVVAPWLPFAKRVVNDASAQANLNVAQPDAPARYVG